jgi:hypothetical protein
MEMVYRGRGQFLKGPWTRDMIQGSRYRLRTPMLSVDPEKETTVLIPGGTMSLTCLVKLSSIPFEDLRNDGGLLRNPQIGPLRLRREP